MWVKSGKFKENQEVSAVMQLGDPGLALFYDKGEITAFRMTDGKRLEP